MCKQYKLNSFQPLKSQGIAKLNLTVCKMEIAVFSLFSPFSKLNSEARSRNPRGIRLINERATASERIAVGLLRTDVFTAANGGTRI